MSDDRNLSESDRRIRNFSEGKYRLTLSEVPVSPLSIDEVCCWWWGWGCFNIYLCPLIFLLLVSINNYHFSQSFQIPSLDELTICADPTPLYKYTTVLGQVFYFIFYFYFDILFLLSQIFIFSPPTTREPSAKSTLLKTKVQKNK